MSKRNQPAAPAPTPAVVQVDAIAALFDDVEERDCSDEEDFELLIGFDPESAVQRLYSMNNSIRLAIEPEQQKEMFIEAGVNLSNEYPWKQISKRFLEDHLTTDTFEMKVLKEKLKEIDGDPLLLIGWVPPTVSEEARDLYIIYLDEITCREAGEIIRRLEAVERRKIERSVVKTARPYESQGSENEVDLYVKSRRTNLVDVELQSVYPLRYTTAKFQFRFAEDVRDGYAELLPDKRVRFENINRKMIDRSIQSGALKVTEEQQTNPAFPRNAWAQYLYDMDEEIKKAKDAETQVEEPPPKEEDDRVSLMMLNRRKKSKEEVKPPVIEEEPEVSQQVEELLEVLEFNAVDMYRDDYPFIAKKEIIKYKVPYLEEVLCFANIPKCKGRFVTSLDWHPEFTGVCVVSYGFNLNVKTLSNDLDEDVVKRSIIQANPVFVWSFDDPLHPKMELYSLREVSCISYCPYDADIIIGGTVNGQIVIWDIKDKLKNIEAEDNLTPGQRKNRNEIREFMNWSKNEQADGIVLPAAISSIERSHENAITSIKWIARNYQCTSKGLFKQDREKDAQYRHFVTSSLDGHIGVWNLDWTPNPEEMAKIPKIIHKIDLPDELREENSVYKVIDELLCPHFRLNLSRPILSMTFSEAKYLHHPLTRVSKDITKRIVNRLTVVKAESFNPKMVIASSVGETVMHSWDGNDFSTAIMNPQSMIVEHFASVHDGPVVCVQQNPFLPNVFISLGGYTFSIWHEEHKDFSIFYRRRRSKLTGVQWSLDRPSVFFLIFEGGSLEIWDLGSRIDIPCIDESLGGKVLTVISQHKLFLSTRLLAVGDFNTNLRMFAIPTAFVHQLPNELETFSNFIEFEALRKREQQVWKTEWQEKNRDIVDAANVAEQQVSDEMERKENKKKEIEEQHARLAEAEAKKRAQKNAKKLVYDLPEKLEKKWQEQNYKRLLKVMMERKKVDKALLETQTKVLKDRMSYDEKKKVAIKESLAKGESDLSTIRARLFPVAEYQTTREELVNESVEEIFKTLGQYTKIEEVALQQISHRPERDAPNLHQILKRCRTNREILNQSLGGGARAKFEHFKRERQQRRMSRFSSISHLPNPSRLVTFSTDPKDLDSTFADGSL